MSDCLQDDRLLEVINTQACRTLLLCEKHVALVRSKTLALRSTYRSMWVVPISEIKIVRGESYDFASWVSLHSLGY